MSYQFGPCIDAMKYHTHKNMFLKPYTELLEFNKLWICSSTPGFTINTLYYAEDTCAEKEGFEKK